MSAPSGNHRHTAAIVTLAIAALAVLAGCSPPALHRPLTVDATLPPAARLDQTPFHPQARYQCGPAALATMLGAQAVQVDPQALVQSVYVPGLKGSLAVELAASARSHGLLVYPLRPVLHDLLQELAAGHPVLVFQDLGLAWWPQRHFAVLYGYDLEHRRLWLRSGTTRELSRSIEHFMHTWARAGRQAWVMLPPERLPATAAPAAFLQAAWALEQTAGSDTALPAWRSATRQWPGAARLHEAHANANFTAGRFQAAADAYLAALGVQAGAASSWNNLAYALRALGCPAQAVSAARCAHRLSPATPNYRATLAEISAGSRQNNSAGDCPALPACDVDHLETQ